MKLIAENNNMGENKICVYAICKNESKFIVNWLASVKDADCIVVVDTGSEDDTYKKFLDAQERYPNLHVYQKIFNPWRFDDARNEALSKVPEDCNILVSLDLDELMSTGWSQILKDNWIEGKYERAMYKFTWSHLPNGADGRVFRYDKIHSRNWIWKYPVHEMLWHKTKDTNHYSMEDTLDLFDRIHLQHYPDKSKSRSSYLPLLEKRAEENPNDHYGLIYLAHEYYYQRQYEKSIALLERIIKEYPEFYNNLEKSSCYLFMGDAYKALQNPEMALECYRKACRLEPTYREPYLGQARVLIEDQEYYNAYYVLIQCMHSTYRHYTWLERDASWSYEPYDLLTLAAYYSGKKAESLVYAVKAYSMNDVDERLKKNIQMILEHTTDAELLQI